MGVLYSLVVAVHLLGMAALVGGYLVAATTGVAVAVNPVLLWGARAQVVTGLVLVGLAEAVLGAEVNHVKIGVKLVLALAVTALAEVAAGRERRSGAAPAGLVHGAGGLAVVTVLVATLWAT